MASKFVKNPTVSSKMRAVTTPLGEKRKVYSFEFGKNKNLEKFGKNKTLSNLKVTVLEQVNQGLHPGKVWENRIFLYFISIVDIRKPILSFH